MAQEKIRTLIVDDSDLAPRALASLIEKHECIHIIGAASDDDLAGLASEIARKHKRCDPAKVTPRLSLALAASRNAIPTPLRHSSRIDSDPNRKEA